MRDGSLKRRFFAEDLRGELVELGPGEVRHAATVLRLSVGQSVQVFDGFGTVAAGKLETLTRHSAVVRIAERRTEARPEPAVELAFSLPKGKRLDWLLEKATELGAARLQPVVFERSVAGVVSSEHARGRWRAVCIAAAKQCGASYLPEIAAPASLPVFLAGTRSGARILGEAGGGASLAEVVSAWSPGSAVTLLVGPEGGLTEAEQQGTRAAGFAAVHLGERVLRVETAALALLAATAALCDSRTRAARRASFTNGPD